MHGLQSAKLHHREKQTQFQGKAGFEEVLPAVPESDRAQGDGEAGLEA